MKPVGFFIYFVVAGLLLVSIGSSILLAPNAFHSANGILLDTDPNLLSEIRAPGALLAGSGIWILAGAFRKSLRTQAGQLSVLVFGSFGLARVLSIVVDGTPSSSLVIAMILELVLASIGLFILWTRMARPGRQSSGRLM